MKMTMNKDDMYMHEIEMLKKHISGEKKLSDEELEEIGMCLEEDIPWSDDWKTHGYESSEAWYEKNKDFLDKLDEVIKLYNSIPEVKALKEKKASKIEDVRDELLTYYAQQ